MCGSFPQHSIISYFRSYLQRVMPSLCRAEENLVGWDVSRKKMHFSSEKELEAAVALLWLALSPIALGARRHMAVPLDESKHLWASISLWWLKSSPVARRLHCYQEATANVWKCFLCCSMEVRCFPRSPPQHAWGPGLIGLLVLQQCKEPITPVLAGWSPSPHPH